MVNQSDFIIPAGCCENDPATHSGDRLEIFGVHDFQIVDGEAGRGLLQEMGSGAIEINGGVRLAGDAEIAGGAQGPDDAFGIGSLRRGQFSIPGGKGKSVIFPDGGKADEINRQIEVPDQTPDQGQLLKVFFSENGEGRLEEVEQFQDNGENAVKVPGTGRAAKVLGEPGLGDQNGMIGLVEGGFLGSEDEINSFGPAEREIVLERAGIGFEVLGPVKLDGIDKNRDRHRSLGTDGLPCPPDQGPMPLVEGPHGWNKGNGEGAFRPLFPEIAHFFENGHFEGETESEKKKIDSKIKGADFVRIFRVCQALFLPTLRESEKVSMGKTPLTRSRKDPIVPQHQMKPSSNMKRLSFTFFASLLLFVPIAQGQQRLKIATVSLERLFNEYHQTEKVQREVNIERARIQRENNSKLAGIREIDAKIQKIREALNDKDLGEKQKLDLRKEAEGLQQDGRSKENERTQYLARKNKTLGQETRKKMRGILTKIQRTVSDTAREGNYDFIFDTSGNSNQGIPFVLHARESTDLTDLLLKAINEE